MSTQQPDNQDDARVDANEEGVPSEDQGVIVTAQPPRATPEDSESDCAPDDAAPATGQQDAPDGHGPIPTSTPSSEREPAG
jgi:hypothetical protein